MKKAIHFFIILCMVFCPLAHAQADPSTKAVNFHEKDLADPYIKDGKYVGDPRFGQYDPNDPTYFHSLRWLVYWMIISLPLASSQASGFPAHISTPEPQMPPKTALAEKN